ncbi:MAG TPA: 16S rRNA (cytidine(1402)-2'-O)-methyltransferase [Thermodesulfovibrionales bacterium]|nr:16S rRNA (cytidine(1402)-2'-O)-methyltransferase [Thermodesulfovibrionales bacterium]
MNPMAGTLYIVSTPIGNLEDITLRALRVLKEVDEIAAEDTRHSSRLLNHYGIAKPLISYWGEKEKVKSEEVLAKLLSGLSIALISDAGTPGISDPGSVLIGRAIEEGIDIVPVPGPSALVAAISISGLPIREFSFIGFLPPRRSQRLKALTDLSTEKRTLIFYEAPHRILDTVEEMYEVFGERKAALVKEITKIHEEALRGKLSDVIRMLAETTIAGEYVILVEGRRSETLSFDEALEEVRTLMKKGKGRKEAVKVVAEQYGMSKNELYERSLGE